MGTESAGSGDSCADSGALPELSVWGAMVGGNESVMDGQEREKRRATGRLTTKAGLERVQNDRENLIRNTSPVPRPVKDGTKTTSRVIYKSELPR
jgi:hypothetical protein